MYDEEATCSEGGEGSFYYLSIENICISTLVTEPQLGRQPQSTN